jgi:hypothetical protein
VIGHLPAGAQQQAVPLLVLVLEWQRFLLGIDPVLADDPALRAPEGAGDDEGALVGEGDVEPDGGPAAENVDDVRENDGGANLSPGVGDPRDGAEDDEGWGEGDAFLHDDAWRERATRRKLRDCWPVGAFLGWKAGTPAPRPKACRLARLCPWCHARRVQDLYRRLRSGPLRRPSQDSYLVLLSAALPPEMVPLDRDWVQLCKPEYRGRLGSAGFLQGALVNFERVLRQEDFDAVEREGMRQLRLLAQMAGVGVGLVSHQVSPHRKPNGGHAFRHELSLLGETALPTEEARRQFEEVTGISGPCFRAIGTVEGATGSSRRRAPSPCPRPTRPRCATCCSGPRRGTRRAACHC